ncbi:hypothetical protein Anas_07231 [Armadillidium nasatum]|uniref:Uncharacterized protein n=1 Tax=Armadillidium nasatum TaxID=96803 RepID=A0A5N5TP57_9CRUS|nr:hypothetical protein Anas_07231 [Armadillidium nasatum]
MAHSNAVRRLQVLRRILQTPKSPFLNFTQKSSSDATKVTLGDISKEIVQPKCVPYVPHLYFSKHIV